MSDETPTSRSSFPDKIKKKVWKNANKMDGHPDNIWRKDANNKPMNWEEYLNPACQNGWKIEYIVPLEKGGKDELENMVAKNIHD